jgi:folate-binding protein YgfZ
MPDAPLHAAMRARGAVMADVDGRLVARRFADSAREYDAMRENAAVVEMPWLDRLYVTGSDRVSFLQGMLSNDVANLAPGAGCQALLLSEQGRAVAEVIVLVGGGDALALDGVEASLAAARASLERYIIADDVEIAVPAHRQRTFALLGPDAARVLERLGWSPPTAAYAHTPITIPDAEVHVVRVPGPGAGGFLCRVPLSDAAAWWAGCLDVGGAAPAGFDAFEALRIESGMPWHGRDVTAETLALEAPYEAAISFRKGCYLGQEVMERVTARGHVNRKLVGVELGGDVIPDAGTRLYAGDREVGWVTSAARSWRLGRAIALAYVRREHLTPGTKLALGGPDGTLATVRGLPF